MHADRAVTAWRTAVMDGWQKCLLRATIWTSCSTKQHLNPFLVQSLRKKLEKFEQQLSAVCSIDQRSAQRSQTRGSANLSLSSCNQNLRGRLANYRLHTSACVVTYELSAQP